MLPNPYDAIFSQFYCLFCVFPMSLVLWVCLTGLANQWTLHSGNNQLTRTVFSNRGRFEQLIRTRTVDEPGQVACATPQVSPAIGCQRRLYQKPSSLFVCLDFDCCCPVAWCSVFELDYPISPFRIAKTTTSQSTHLLDQFIMRK